MSVPVTVQCVPHAERLPLDRIWIVTEVQVEPIGLQESDAQPTTFEAGDMRNEIAEFQDPKALERFSLCRRAVAEQFTGHPEPVLQALTGALLTGGPAAGQECVLIGMRNSQQARAAARLGTALSTAEAEWIQAIYRGELAPTAGGVAGTADAG